MRNVVKTIAAGMLVVCFSGGLAYADGAKYSVKPLTKRVAAGGELKVDVLVAGVPNLGAFQVGLKATGGTEGTFTVKSVVFNETEPTFVFKNASGVKAVDSVNNEAGGAVLSGSVDATQPRYVATFTLVASDNAKGNFVIGFNQDPNHTFLRNENAVPITVKLTTATVAVFPSSEPASRKSKRGSR